MKFKKSFWNSKNVTEMYSMENAEHKNVHPFISELINNFNPKNMLDYGCGDAFLCSLINATTKIDLYDKNSISLKKTYEKLKANNINCEFITKEDYIKSNYYDLITLNFVLVCVDNELERNLILKKIYNSKKEDGYLIYTSTHPCFRQYENSACKTSFDFDNFDYFKEEQPFTLTMKGEIKDVSFIDYHYTLSNTINTFIKNGFKLQQVIELPDLPFKNRAYNKQVSPFIIMIFK